jgi:hypothetical protein
LLFLLRRQVLPGFHAPKHLLLAIWRKAVKALQSLLKLLLAVRWKPAELRVALQCSPLLIERQTAMLIQPLSRMVPVGGWLIGTGLLILRFRLGR